MFSAAHVESGHGNIWASNPMFHFLFGLNALVLANRWGNDATAYMLGNILFHFCLPISFEFVCVAVRWGLKTKTYCRGQPFCFQLLMLKMDMATYGHDAAQIKRTKTWAWCVEELGLSKF